MWPDWVLLSRLPSVRLTKFQIGRIREDTDLGVFCFRDWASNSKNKEKLLQVSWQAEQLIY